MVVTQSGKVKEVNPVQPLNAKFPTLVSPSGRLTVFSAVQSSKAAVPIEMIPFATVILVSPVQERNAFSEILPRLAGRESSFIEAQP